MMKISTLIAVMICVSSTCHAYQLIGTEALSEELVARHYTINPNLDAIIVIDRTIPTFEYQTFYAAGAADEAEGQQGRIHFLEHIMLGMDEMTTKNGGQKNASTFSHFTRFILKFPKDKFDFAVEIDRDRYYNTIIDKEVVEREKKIVLTERSRRIAAPTHRSADYFARLIYGRKSFNSLGTEAFIKQLEPVCLKAYYENFLRLQKRLIVIIGDVDVDHVLTKLDAAYGHEQTRHKPSNESPVPPYPNREVLGKRLRRTTKNLDLTLFRKGWYTPNLGHRDYAGLLILERVLEKPENSLKSSLVASGLAKSFSVSITSYKGFSSMLCYAELPHNTSRSKLHKMIQAELENLKSISETELNAARNQKLKTMYSTFYSPSSMAASFGSAFAHADDPLLYPKLTKDLKSIHREDIPRIIDQYLTDDNSITHALTVETKEPTPKKRTALRIIVMESVGFLTLLVGLVALMVWGNKKLSQRLSRKAITADTDDADERE